RRRGLWCLVDFWRSVQHSYGGAAGNGRAETHPVSHPRAVLAHLSGAADRSQPSFGGDGRVFDGPVRQVSRGAGVGSVTKAIQPSRRGGTHSPHVKSSK